MDLVPQQTLDQVVVVAAADQAMSVDLDQMVLLLYDILNNVIY
jgi:hypothetical protein